MSAVLLMDLIISRSQYFHNKSTLIAPLLNMYLIDKLALIKGHYLLDMLAC